MTWKSLIPLYGKRSVRQKLRDIEGEAGSLPIIFGVLFGKVIENIVLLKYIVALKFLAASIFVAIVYLYMKEAKEKASEIKEEVTE